MLLDDIKKSIQTSLKSGDSERVSTLRMLLSAIRYAAIKIYGADGETKMTDEDVLSVIQKQAKERRESIDAYTKGGRNDLAEKEQKELAILQTYLPSALTDQEIEQMIREILAAGDKNFGSVMKQAVAKAQGRADGSRISSLVKKLLV